MELADSPPVVASAVVMKGGCVWEAPGIWEKGNGGRMWSVNGTSRALIEHVLSCQTGLCGRQLTKCDANEVPRAPRGQLIRVLAIISHAVASTTSLMAVLAQQTAVVTEAVPIDVRVELLVPLPILAILTLQFNSTQLYSWTTT